MIVGNRGVRRRWEVWLLGLLVWLGAGGRVEADPASLRERLDALETGPGRPAGALRSVTYLLDVADRIERGFSKQAAAWRARADRYLNQLEQGQDPYPAARGEIVNRGYVSPVSTRMQGYAIYIPPDYDPEKSYPLMITLHGGSSNGNLFLGVVLGNNMNWKEYSQHLWDDYTPRWSPDWIVVAPDGFGQVMWRFMGERDVFDVLADVQRHYSVDRDRIVLSGLSNGGVGAYALGARHGDRFSLVQAIAGAPSWVLYAGERTVKPPERVVLEAWSALSLLPNLAATDFRYYHGNADPGPMRPAYVKRFDAALAEQQVEAKGVWYEAGHDLLYRVQRHGRVFKKLGEVTRDPSPARVHLRTGDLRAARQHWLQITRLASYDALAEARAEVVEGKLQITTENVASLAIDLRTLPDTGDELQVRVNDQNVLDAPRAELGSRVHLTAQEGGRFRAKLPPDQGLHKRRGLSGPITDAYYTRMVHVYGTRSPDHLDSLRQSAQQGARGWPKWLWGVQQEVVPDTAVTPELMQDATLVLYGTPGSNQVLASIAGDLPIRVDEQGVHLGKQHHTGKDVGVRFIYPNPTAPGRYVVVQAGTTPRAVRLGHNLPDFLPDYVIYDARSARRRPRLVPGRPPPPARGFFDARWQLPVSGR